MVNFLAGWKFFHGTCPTRTRHGNNYHVIYIYSIYSYTKKPRFSDEALAIIELCIPWWVVCTFHLVKTTPVKYFEDIPLVNPVYKGSPHCAYCLFSVFPTWVSLHKLHMNAICVTCGFMLLTLTTVPQIATNFPVLYIGRKLLHILVYVIMYRYA